MNFAGEQNNWGEGYHFGEVMRASVCKFQQASRKKCSLRRIGSLFLKDNTSYQGPHAGGGEKCEEEGAAERCYRLHRIPFPYPYVLLSAGG